MVRNTTAHGAAAINTLTIDHSQRSEQNEDNHSQVQQRRDERQRGNSANERNRDQQRDERNVTYNQQEVVLIMDSNMNFIEEERFWRSTFKLKCGRADLLENKITSYDLSAATDIIVGTGTNDIERGADAVSIFAQLRRTVEYLSSTYKGNIYLQQLPPMEKENHNKVVQELNNLIKKHSPGKINVILQDDLTIEDLHDKKHIRKRSLRKFIKNMKDVMRDVYNKTTTKRAPTKPKEPGEKHPTRTNENNSSNLPVQQPTQPLKNPPQAQGQEFVLKLIHPCQYNVIIIFDVTI